MSVIYQDFTSLIRTKTSRGVNLALRMALDDIDREAFKNTPKDTGNLRKNLRKSVSGNKGTIVWSSNYASYQERGYGNGPIRKYTTAGTGAHYAENAVKKISAKFDSYLRRVM